MSKLPTSEERKLAELMAGNLILRCNQLCLFSEWEIANRIGMKRSTFHNRRLDPAGWKLIEFTRAAVALGVSLEWLCTDHANDHEKIKNTESEINEGSL
ncbi:MAG: hypothetical protein NC299_11845 [Lachnospiraceae bacterium]|nr:hypothetical protein [Lachnospiraceae bacterium]